MTLKNNAKGMKSEKNLTKQPRSVALLQDFGLTKNETLIYIYLLERGTETGASKIALGTGLHRQYVYLSMERLIELGLIEPVTHGKQKKYKASPPAQVEKIARRRALQAGDIVRELNTFSAVGNDQDFEVLQGARAIQRYEMDYAEAVEAGSEEYIIGGNARGFAVAMGDELKEYLSVKDSKQMKVRYLRGEDENLDDYKNQKSFEARTLPGLPQGVTHMVIRKDTVLFFSFLTPPLVYVISSKVVAENYQRFFGMLWGMAT